MQRISKHRVLRFMLEKVFRLKVDYTVPEGARKSVLLFAPHTSMWDFVAGKWVMDVMELRVKIMIKKEAFVFPIASWLKSIGGIPVDRRNASTMPEEVASLLRESDEMCLLICPEGTRKRTEHWKKGFYYIAQKAGVPVFMTYIDWKTRRAGIGPAFHVTGDYAADFLQIQSFYKGMCGWHKGQFNLE